MTHQEIAKGILDVENNPSDQCVCFVRNISNLEEDLSNEQAPAYIDFLQGQHEIDADAVEMLSSLFNEQIKEKLNESQIFQSQIDWSPMGIDPDGNKDHLEYIKQFCEKFTFKVQLRFGRGRDTICGSFLLMY